jgi:hypothetical protein
MKIVPHHQALVHFQNFLEGIPGFNSNVSKDGAWVLYHVVKQAFSNRGPLMCFVWPAYTSVIF